MRRGRQNWRGLTLLGAILSAIAVSAPPAQAAVASWEFDAQTYDFGPVMPGSGPTDPHLFKLTNTGETALGIGMYGIGWWGGEALDPELFQITSHDCNTILPQESCSIGVVFNPVTVGPKRGSLSVVTPGGEPPAASVMLYGEGAGPWVSVAPERLHFDPVEVGKPSPVQVVTVENQGSLDLTIGDVYLTDYFGARVSGSAYTVAGETCHAGLVVPSKGTCTVNVAFEPQEAGFFQSRLAIEDDAPNSPHSIEVGGAANLPADRSPGPFPGTTVITGPRKVAKDRSKTSAGRSKESTAPAIRITHHPGRRTVKKSATLWFVATPVGLAEECRLDKLEFRPCSAPIRYSGLTSGPHQFTVRARGRSSSTSARYRWRVLARGGER